eukprot:COSAG01_NODE_3740_length_5746_cov_2.375421_12_plen_85_part_00
MGARYPGVPLVAPRRGRKQRQKPAEPAPASTPGTERAPRTPLPYHLRGMSRAQNSGLDWLRFTCVFEKRSAQLIVSLGRYGAPL